MPQKKGNGGYGLEQYDENNGQYVEDGVPNKSYDNPEEKILESMGLQKPDLMKNGKIYLKHSSPTSNLNFYIESMNKIAGSVPQSDYKNILINYMKTKKARVSFTNSYDGNFSSDTNTVNLGYYVAENKENYWIFFHEEGHSIDWNYGNNSFLSDNFVGKNGKTLLQCLVIDGNQNIQKIISDYELYEKKVIKQHFLEIGLGEYKTYNELKKEFEIKKREKPTELYYEIQNIQKKARNLIQGKSEQEIEEIMNSPIGIELQETFDKLHEERNYWIKEEFPTEEEFLEQNKEYEENLIIAKRKSSFNYKCISDIVSGLFGKPLNYYNHPQDYWQQDKNLKNEEFFANAFECLIQNSSELELLNKYFPNSMEVVKEILQKIYDEQKGEMYYE